MGSSPEGLYSGLLGTLGPDSEQPLCPGVEHTLPLDAFAASSGPTPNSFVAGGDDAADYRGRVAGIATQPADSRWCLLPTLSSTL